MKKIFRFLGVCIASVAVAFSLASCSNVSEDYAQKINEKAKEDKKYSYEDVKKKLGDECIDGTAEVFGYRGGVLFGVKGIKSVDDLKAKVNAGENVEGIVVIISNGYATSASFGVITAEQLALIK